MSDNTTARYRTVPRTHPDGSTTTAVWDARRGEPIFGDDYADPTRAEARAASLNRLYAEWMADR